MAEDIATDVLVVGGGPGGYACAIRAGQLGLKTVLVEADRAGGTCLLRGCIPSKALIHAAEAFAGMRAAVGDGHMGIRLERPPELRLADTVAWKDGIVDRLAGGVAGLLRRAKVRTVHGWATFSDAKTCTVAGADGEVTVTARHVVLATGSEPVALPHLPFGGPVISSAGALSLPHLPKRLAVVGAGYIGLELGSAFARFGTTVTVIEMQDRILPTYDEALTRPVAQWLERAGVRVLCGARADGLEAGADGPVLKVAAAGGEAESIPADAVLVTVGRRPVTQGWGLEAMAVDLDERGFVKVDDQCRTAMRGVFAIGDLVGEPMLAHKATAQGVMVAEILAGHRRRFEPAAIPAVCFTDPEIVTVGLSPDEAAATGVEIVEASFPFAASGRALSMDAGDDGGFVRVVARKDDHLVLGIQAVGRHVSELSAAFVTALEMGAVVEDLAATIQAHPTLGEALHETAARVLGHALHV